MNSDFSDLLKALNVGEIEYLVVGGYAVSKHAEPRYTKDLDIWINNDRENAERVYEVLWKFGSPLVGITPEDFTNPTLVYQIGVEPSRIDILMGLKALDFDDCWTRRVSAAIDDTEALFISIDDLIKNKRSVGRPQDLLDAEALELSKRKQDSFRSPIADEFDQR